MTAQIGPVYDKVIRDVIESSRIDFEESGVDPGTLEKMKEIWQKKLSGLNIGHFPWDPPARPQAAPAQAPPKMQPMPRPSMPMQHQPVKVKLEPQNMHGVQQMPQHIPNIVPGGPAAMRAAHNIHQRYGQQAAQQVSALQGATNLLFPGQMPQQPKPGQGPARNSLQASQLDGVAEELGADEEMGHEDALRLWRQVVQKRQIAHQAGRINPEDGDEEMTTAEIDHLIKRGIEHKYGSSTTALPASLSSLYPAKASATTEAIDILPCSQIHVPIRTVSNPASLPISSVDGPSDSSPVKPDLDDETINSDLDDDDDALDDDDDDDANRQLMLCTYDKVQRVKNKWKATLKDGVLVIGGREYIFHKAMGEYEW